MVEITDTAYFKNRHEWRKWLSKNYRSKQELWLIFYRKDTGKPGMRTGEAVEEALCFGWIDGILKKLDRERYALRFTPRKKDSIWSETNLKRARKMVREGKMRKEGLEKFRAAKKNPLSRIVKRDFEIPEYITKGLKSNKNAWNNFEKLPPSHKQQYVWWIASAKRGETRERRIKEARRILSKRMKLGMK